MKYESEYPLTFDDGVREKNAYWIFKTLESREKYICERLVLSAGPLGWNKRSMNAAHIKAGEINVLVEKGIVRKASLYEVAKSLTENQEVMHEKMEFDEKGGYLVLSSPRDRLFYLSIDQALDIVNGNENDSQELRYQIAVYDLYALIDSIIFVI